MPPAVWTPNPGPQTEFLATTAREVLYGGAVGGGKTDALLALPLRWADHAGLRAIYLRRKKDDCREGIDRVRDLYPQVMQVRPPYGWHETEYRWRFPAGGFLQFGYAQHTTDIEEYKSAEYNLVLFDELTEFDEYQYLFMLTRNRSKSADLPALMRAATNPGGVGMQWVDERFIGTRMDGTQKYQPYKIYRHEQKVEGMGKMSITRQYIPSTVFDNPELPNVEQYIAGLAHLPDAEREAMLYGRWGKFRGQYFKRGPRAVDPGIKRDQHGSWYIVRAMDYGWSDPACVLWLVVYENGVVEVAGELYERRMTTDSIVQLGTTIEASLGAGSGPASKIRHSVLSPDAFKAGTDGEPSIAHNLGTAGWWFNRANNDRISGWHQIARLIEQDRLRVWRGRAPNLTRTLTKLPHEPNDPRDVKRKGVEDHAPEALRYACMALAEGGAQNDEGEGPKGENISRRNRDPFWEKWKAAAEEQLERQEGVNIPGLGSGW